MAKTLGIGTNRFFAKLRNDHILDRDNLPIQRYIDAGYFKVVKSVFSWPGSSHQSYNFTTKATGKGVDWLVERYRGRV
jgi:phage antirepressor YoqD-like protein